MFAILYKHHIKHHKGTIPMGNGLEAKWGVTFLWCLACGPGLCFPVLLSILLLASISFPGGSEDKVSACNAQGPGSIPGLERFPWRRKWQPTPIFLPGESHGQRSLAGYSPQGHRVGHDWATSLSLSLLLRYIYLCYILSQFNPWAHLTFRDLHIRSTEKSKIAPSNG